MMAISCMDGKLGTDNGKYVRYTPEHLSRLMPSRNSITTAPNPACFAGSSSFGIVPSSPTSSPGRSKFGFRIEDAERSRGKSRPGFKL